MSEAFVYLWYDALNKMYYLGKHKGSPDDTYTHSSTIWESFTKDNIPEGVTRRILAYGTNEEMCILEHKLLVNRKKRCWNRYYNESLGDPRYVDQSGENHHMYGKTHSPEARKKISIAISGDKNGMFGKTHTTEAIESMRQAKLGTTASKETREKLSKMRKGKDTWNKGKKCPQIGRANLGRVPWNKGKTGVYSEETRKKISESMKGIAPWNKGTGMTKEERNRRQRERRARKKAETQEEGTLKGFLK